MTNFIPLFPLSIVVFPGEKLNLHIFEPRYKQLIKDCFANKKPFGIPAVIEGKSIELGTLVEIVEISRQYEDGKMDIQTRGLTVFKILEVIKELPEKLYGGAIVSYLNNYNNGSRNLMHKIIEDTRALHQHIEVNKNFGKPDEELNSFDMAHHMGLSPEQEYQLMEYENELHRQEYLKRHLANILPVVKEMESLKKKIRLNGHFKNLEGFDLN